MKSLLTFLGFILGWWLFYGAHHDRKKENLESIVQNNKYTSREANLKEKSDIRGMWLFILAVVTIGLILLYR